jgi:PAS domain S-box-containing protein
VLASSLDQPTTMAQVARLTVPRLADLCVIDILAGDGSIRGVAVAAADPRVGAQLERLRARHPLDPDGPHPVAHVLRTAEPVLLPEMGDELLAAIAQGSEHARFMIDEGYRSLVVAPLGARSRTLGALSLLRLGDHDPYDDHDLGLACELARRAALAMDNARLFGELAALERRQEAILENLAEAVTVEDRDGRTVFANQAAADLLKLASPDELTSAAPGSIAERFLILDERGRELDLAALPGRRLFAGEEVEPLVVHNIVRTTGEERWLQVRSSPIVDPSSGRVQFAVNVLENITEVKRAQVAESFMAQASRVLGSSMDYAETLKRVARLAVPQIADWCAIDVVTEDGEIELVAVHHADPAKVALADRLRRYYAPNLDERGGIGEVIRTGRPLIYTDLSPDLLAAYARDAEHLELMRAIGAKAGIIVPLASAVRTIGTVTLVTSESLRRLSELDLDLAVRLGRRAGTAVEHSRLYTERTRIAQVLQDALLPDTLPAIPGAEVAARYHAAGELNEVGGDFYDVIELEPNTWALVIGDVVGKGPRAAGVTALARHTLRAAAMTTGAPREMLGMLHRALSAQPAGADQCTVCLVVVELHDGRTRLTITLAGHPPPLVIDGHGGVRQVGDEGTLLGVVEPLSLNGTSIELEPGETLVLYTDGVLDAGQALGEPLGEGGLTEVCRGGHRRSLQELLASIERAALARAGGSLRDDVALLGLRLGDAG